MSRREINVFISSPIDVKNERGIVKRILYDLNLHLAKHLGLKVIPLMWEDITSSPGLAQEIVLKEFPPEEWDIFIGIIWDRFGSPTGMANRATGKPYLSGTQQEFHLAYKCWKAKQRPKILFYRCTGANTDPVNAAQRKKVDSFFGTRQKDHPFLYHSYQTPEEFTRLVRRDLDAALLQISSPPAVDIATKATKVGLQVVMDDFNWTFNGDTAPRELQVNVTTSSRFLMSTPQKHAYLRKVKEAPNAKKAMRDLRKALKTTGSVVPIHCPDWPVRYVSGGVLPMVRIESQDYYLLFYRIGTPKGWNLANGGAIDARELHNPTLIIEREFGEEVVAVNVNTCPPEVYTYTPSPGVFQPSYQKKAIRKRWPVYAERSMPIKEWKGGPDTVNVAVYDDEYHAVSGVFLSITPEDSGIEVDRVVVIEGTKDMCFVDGDVSEVHPVGRLAGLFKCKPFDVCAKNFLPDVLFFGTERVVNPNRKQFNEQLDRYFREIRLTGENPRTYPAQLCPITKELIKRYLGFEKRPVKPRKPK